MDAKKKKRIIHIFNQLEKYDIELHTYSSKEIVEAYEQAEQTRAKEGREGYYGACDGLVWVAWSSAENDLELEGDD